MKSSISCHTCPRRIIRGIVLLCCGLLVLTAQGKNLLRHGDFTESGTSLYPECRANGGALSLHTEEGSWNRCGKLSVTKVIDKEGGKQSVMASVWLGGTKKHAGFAVHPNRTYVFSVELRSDISRGFVSAVEWVGDDLWKDLRMVRSSLGKVSLKKGWSRYEGTFKTGPEARRAALCLQVWQEGAAGQLTLKVGDYLLFDNVMVREKKAVSDWEKGHDRPPFSVAPVPVTADFSIPFLPEEIFETVDDIKLKAAVNERKALPLAVANLTDRTAAYRVIVETRDDYLGEYGLRGFPGSQIEMREGLRCKDSDADRGRLRLDPLPLMNEACVITVPPGEAGLVWIDFDTSGVKPGSYKGRIRIIPLSEPATFEPIGGSFHHRKYTGSMKDIRLSLTVMNMILPSQPKRGLGFFQPACNEAMFKAMADLGTNNFGLSPWSFHFERDEKGMLDLNRNNQRLDELRQLIRRHQQWGQKYGVKPHFLICFSAYRTFQSKYARGKDAKNSQILWPQWLKGVAQIMAECGVDVKDYAVETWDEPDPKLFEEVIMTHRLAKKAVPDMRLMLTLGAKIMSASDMEKLSPHTDGWVLWSHGYFSQPDHLAFVKKVLAEGKEVHHYTCSTSMRVSLDRNYRRNAWMGERFQLTGNMMYIFSENYSMNGSADFKIAHRGSVAYRSFDRYLPSIRYMAMREGVTDIRYLELLKKLGGRRTAIRKILRKASRRVVDENAHNPQEADRVREEIASMILKLQGR